MISVIHPTTSRIARTCGRCLISRDVTDFPRDRNAADGLRSFCRQCHREYMRQWLAKPENRTRFNATAAEQRRKHREKVNARQALWRAVVSGAVVKSPCVVGINCDGRIEAHHHNYRKPLEVVWLCRRHHEMMDHGHISMERAA